MRYHFSGVAGAGMNPLACLMRARGHEVQGSDRSFDQGKNREIAAHLRRLAIQLAAHDGTLVGYRPAIGLVHNVSRDHAELDALRPQFSAFAESCGRLLVNAACPEAAALGRRFKASTYGVSPGADTRLRVTSAGPRRATGSLRLEGRVVVLDVPQPGLHNLENAAAATLLALELGVDASALEAPLARFPGVARRFEVVGTTTSGIRVVDDYAHNGEKIRAAV